MGCVLGIAGSQSGCQYDREVREGRHRLAWGAIYGWPEDGILGYGVWARVAVAGDGSGITSGERIGSR